MTQTKTRYFPVVFGLAIAISAVQLDRSSAADWPAFRGPTNRGVAAEKTAPVKWSAQENVRWSAPLPRPGNGSPIVIGSQVFVTSVEDAEGKNRSLYAFNADTGEKQWVRTVEFGKKMPTHDTNPYGGTTPVSDGKQVVVWHASAGLYCYDMQGKEIWKRDLGEFQHIWGYGTSPILYQGKVILNSGPGKRVFLGAYELATGKTLWETEEPSDGSTPDRNAANQYQGSWSTPVVTKVGGKDQIVVMMPTRVVGYEPASGKIAWTCDGMRHDRGDLAYSSPVLVDDICFVTGGYNGVAMAFRLGGEGNLTELHRLWRTERQPQSIGSGVAVGGLVYRPNAGPSTIDCIDPKTGKVLWSERSPAGNHWGSMVQVGDLIYLTGQTGTTVVFKPNPQKLETVSVNPLDDATNATPAVANGRLYFRMNKGLVCVGK